MGYLLALEIFLTFLAFTLKLGAVYLLIKFFNRTFTLSRLFKAIPLFELSVFLLYFLVSSFLPSGSLPLLLAFPIISAMLFVLLIQKFSLLNWKKAMVVFILLFVVVTPLVSFLSQLAGSTVAEIPILKREISKTLPSDIAGLLQNQKKQPFPLQLVVHLQQSVAGDFYLSNIREYLIAR